MAQVTVKHKFIHQAPRKLRLIGDVVRGLPAEKAAHELSVLPQVAGKTIRKVILAGIAAAKQQGLIAHDLFVSEVKVDEGPKMKRFVPISRGRSSRITKRMSHVTVSLTDEAVIIASGKAYKKELRAVTPAAKASKKEVKATDTAKPEVTEKDTAVEVAIPAPETTPATSAEGSK